MKKVIGLIPLYDDEKDSLWMLPGYMKVLEACGALPIVLPLTSDPAELRDAFSLCDGILMTGGHDVDPELYGEKASEACGIPCRPRDEMERFLFSLCLQEDKPVLGICRGIQLMNVLLGGDLYQDLPTEHPSDTEHHMSPPYDRPIHRVEVEAGTRLSDLIGAGEYAVNSYHHQAVKTLAPRARAMARSEDGLVEALEVPGQRFAVGVQWHPEFAFEKDPKCRTLVQAFVDACGGSGN